MTETADILVIGGGIGGIGAAARLAPEAKVIVLEREDTIGYHATGRSAAVFIRNYGNATVRALNAASAPVLENPDGISDFSLLTPRGEMMVAAADEIEALERYLAGSDGIEEITPDDAVDRIPILRRERIERAVFEPNAQDIDVDRLLQGFARLARSGAGRIERRAEVAEIARARTTWQVRTRDAVYEAPIVVNAAGAWADGLAAMAHVAPVGLTPMRRSIAVLPMPDDMAVERWPLVVSGSENWYAKPERGRLLVSPADEDPVDPHDAWPDDMVVAEGIHRFEQAMTISVTRVERSWAGLRSFVADRTPVCGFAPDADGFFWLAGQGGYGVQTSPALSRLAGDLVLGRTPQLTPDVVAALSPARDGIGPRTGALQ